MTDKKTKKFREQLLAWYDANYRPMPWRAPPGKQPSAYHDWLSEIMLQQTTVAAVIPYFLKFIKNWPDVHALAAARQEDVMREWAGLGYYARARNLHACAKIVSEDLNGIFPDNEADLRKLPGIGPYTAAAITAIAFNKPATVVDGNVERVMARYFAIEEPLPQSKPLLKALAAPFFENFSERPGDLAQAFMDLGAVICAPAVPRCQACPVSEHCAGRIRGIAAALPAKTKKMRPQKFGQVYWVTDSNGRILMHRRPQKGLLGGMVALPTSEWEEKKSDIRAPEALKSLEISRFSREKVLHAFTHFDLELRLMWASASNFKSGKDYFWLKAGEVENSGLPTVFRKAFRLFAS